MAKRSESAEQEQFHLEIPLGFKEGISEKKKPRPGFRGRLLLTASPWNV